MPKPVSSQPARIALRSMVRPIAELSASERQQLFEVMSGHFENVDEAQFHRDLNEKTWVVLVVDAAERIRGFSTLMPLETTFEGQRLVAIYAGDTVMDPDCWGHYGWVHEWGRQAFAMADAAGTEPVYLLILTATHRTYRFMPGFFFEYYPRPDRPTPPEFQARIDALVRLKFPAEYDAKTGIVHLQQPTPVRQDRLDPVVADRAEENEFVRFFLEANPGFANGDFLACMTEYSRRNLTPLGYRVTNIGEAPGT